MFKFSFLLAVFILGASANNEVSVFQEDLKLFLTTYTEFVEQKVSLQTLIDSIVKLFNYKGDSTQLSKDFWNFVNGKAVSKGNEVIVKDINNLLYYTKKNDLPKLIEIIARYRSFTTPVETVVTEVKNNSVLGDLLNNVGNLLTGLLGALVCGLGLTTELCSVIKNIKLV